MDEPTRARIFDPFFSRKGPARGLGMSAMLGILRAHGAGMRVRTAPGQGTTFTVWFPFTSSAESPAPSEPVRAHDPDSSPTKERRRRVLLADDEPMLRRLFGRVLELAGFEVEVTENGRDAMQALEAPGADYRLVILDITMPEMTGPEVLARLRASGSELRNAPVILTSGYAAEGATLDERTRFLKKPFAASELTALVTELDDD